MLALKADYMVQRAVFCYLDSLAESKSAEIAAGCFLTSFSCLAFTNQ